MKVIDLRDNKEPQDEECSFAEQFAYNLLMPESAFKSKYRQYNGHKLSLSVFFGVPGEKVINRCKQLGLID